MSKKDQLDQLDTVIMTVSDTEDFKDLQFLNPRIARFRPVKSYSGKSDASAMVRRSIYTNTLSILRESALQFVLILQDDVRFIVSKEDVLNKICLALTFLRETPTADFFFLGYHPNARHEPTFHAGVSKLLYALHWQAVIFRQTSYTRLPERIPNDAHSDVFLQEMNKLGELSFYGLDRPIASQKCDRMMRFYEYGLWYEARAAHPMGDPLPIFIAIWTHLPIIIIVISVFLHKGRHT